MRGLCDPSSGDRCKQVVQMESSPARATARASGHRSGPLVDTKPLSSALLMATPRSPGLACFLTLSYLLWLSQVTCLQGDVSEIQAPCNSDDRFLTHLLLPHLEAYFILCLPQCHPPLICSMCRELAIHVNICIRLISRFLLFFSLMRRQIGHHMLA